MVKGNHQGRVLKDHRKVGKKLIPPLMQIPNLKEVSYRDNMLPNLVWVSAIFLRNPDRKSVQCIVNFLIRCKEILADDNLPALIFLNNFDRLRTEQKSKIVEGLEDLSMLNFLRENLTHQFNLFDNYPLSFLLDGCSGLNKENDLNKLKEDVAALLDRHTLHSTKVQTTALVSMMATGKLILPSSIDLPDFNSIFTSPDSDESQKVASFVRASLNNNSVFEDTENNIHDWSKSFWKQSFDLEGCS